MSHRRWCFTINNYEQDDLEQLSSLKDSDDVSCLYVSKERGANGTAHLQGYVSFKTTKRLTAAKRLVDARGRAHLEPARGTRADNRRYIIEGINPDGTRKVDTRDAHGVLIPDAHAVYIEHEATTQGQRTDLEAATDLLAEGGLKRVAEQAPGVFVKYHKGLQALETVLYSGGFKHRGPRKDFARAVWLYGPTGIGKSYFAHAETASENVCHLSMLPNWFDGYHQHEWVVMDEIDKVDVRIGHLLRWLDRYPMEVPVKGSSVNWNPGTIVLTSSVDPCLLFPDTEWHQLRRRLTNVGTRNSQDEPWMWRRPGHWPDELPPPPPPYPPPVGESEDEMDFDFEGDIVVPDTPDTLVLP